MQQRRSSVSGRPSGTDGSDFSYRMVVDSRYTKVAKGKSRLSALILTQAVFQLIGLVYTYLSAIKEGPNALALSSAYVGLISLVIGELGRRRSRVIFLRFCAFASTIAILLSIYHLVESNLILEIIEKPSDWQVKKFELLEISRILFGSLLQIFLVSTIISLISNMSPPKRAS